MRRFILCGIFALAILPNRFAFASADSNGPNGINSSGLSQTSAGIDIGQVEPKRPGDPNGGPMFIESQLLYNSTVDPEQVFYRQSSNNFTATANLSNEVEAHAVRVAGVMISTDPDARGVATDADLFSVGINEQSGGSLETAYESSSSSIEPPSHIAKSRYQNH
jgi:hypothetical protein